jgi:predicted enzyme related to lactoylglutathione lyase
MNRLVHLELHTRDLAQARRFYSEMFGWRPEQVDTPIGSYLALDFGADACGGVVECGTQRSVWIPYVEVAEIDHATARASEHGATVLLEPREGPAGWRSVVATAGGAEVALWQQKPARVLGRG